MRSGGALWAPPVRGLGRIDPQPKSNLVHLAIKYDWHDLVATILTILLIINWPNLVPEMREISVTHNFQGYFSRTSPRRRGNPVWRTPAVYSTNGIDYLAKQEAQLLLGDRATRKHAKDSWNGHGNDNPGWMTFKYTSRSSKEAPIESYDFPLVVYSNFCCITHRFWEIWCERVQ